MSKLDVTYQKCQNAFPLYYFNNLGVTHLKLQKYNMAIYYFSKALKFIDKTFSGTLSASADSENPNERISHLNSQKTSEILYNYGLVRTLVNSFRPFTRAASSRKRSGASKSPQAYSKSTPE